MNIVRVEIGADYSRAESAGAAGLLQVDNVTGYLEDDTEVDLVHYIDQGYFYKDIYEILRELKEKCKKYNFINQCEIEIL